MELTAKRAPAITRDLTVRQLARLASIRPTEMQRRLAGAGVFARLDDIVDQETAQTVVSTLHRSLTLKGDLPIESTQRVLGQLNLVWQQAGPPVSLDVDLRDLGFIYPSAMALLTTAILCLRQDGVSISIRQPANTDVDDYLNRMAFYRLAGVEAPYRWRKRDPTGRFVEIKQIQSEEEGDSVIRDVLRILERRMEGFQAVRNAVQYAFHELVNNVFHHSQSTTQAIICAQSYDRKREVELAVVDSGRGIPASLSENPSLQGQFSTASEAIELATQPRVTGRPGHNTGEGLFFTLEFIRDNKGCACLHSRDGVLRIRSGHTVVEGAPLWPGTWVGLRFKTDQPVNTERLFARYAPPESEYEWLFDDSAVSYG